MPLCKNIHSRRRPQEPCRNTATHGDFCGRHYRHPIRWALSRGHLRRICSPFTTDTLEAGTAIATALKFRWRLRCLLRQGPARFAREISNNTTEIVSGDEISTMKADYLFSFRDVDTHVYSFDIRSLHSLFHHARIEATIPLNPYTRSELPTSVIDRCNKYVVWCEKYKIPVTWTPLTPPTPEQQGRMRVVELFHQINALNYYSSPEWFFSMEEEDHIHFYQELYDIWTFRAFLTPVQKNTIVPDYQRKLFQRPTLRGIESIDAMQKINRSTIRHMIQSAHNVQDRVLGAMYVISAFTIVNEEARDAYPWLYESIQEEDPVPAPMRRVGFFGTMLGGLLGIPPLALPPAHRD